VAVSERPDVAREASKLAGKRHGSVPGVYASRQLNSKPGPVLATLAMFRAAADRPGEQAGGDQLGRVRR
jgi:hypothetical protein